MEPVMNSLCARISRYLVVLLVLGVTAAGASAEVTISAAISLSGVLENVRPILEKAAGDKVTFTFGASGTLAGQIQQGAPVDLFISADRGNVDKLLAAKAVDAASVRVIAENELVLVQSKNAAPLSGFGDL